MNTPRPDGREATPTIATEIELKFELPEHYTLPDLSGISPAVMMSDPREQQLDALYFDTDHLALARRGITLRRRSGGSDAGWHLKLPRTAGERIEVRLPALSEPADGSRQVPAVLAERLGAYVTGIELRPVARLRTHRIVYPVLDADQQTLAEIAVDEVRSTILVQPPVLPDSVWRELEVELVAGDRRLLHQLRDVVVASGAMAARATSKLERALGELLRDTAETSPASARGHEFAVAAHLNGAAAHWHRRMDAVTAMRDTVTSRRQVSDQHPRAW